MLQHVARGRLDLMVGRGNTVPVYPWFGKDISQGVALALEKFSVHLNRSRSVRHRARDAGARDRSGREPRFADGLSTTFACAVCAGVQPLHGGIDLRKVKSRLSDEGSNLRPFEGDRCPFRVVLVIAVGVTGSCHYCVEVVAQARQTSERLFTLRLEQPAGLIHAVHADIDSQRSELPPSALSCRRVPPAACGVWGVSRVAFGGDASMPVSLHVVSDRLGSGVLLSVVTSLFLRSCRAGSRGAAHHHRPTDAPACERSIRWVDAGVDRRRRKCRGQSSRRLVA